MMKLLATSLVLMSLLAAVLWSPCCSSLLHKESHRVVVVKYEKEPGGSTKVLISPQNAVPSAEEKPAEGTISPQNAFPSADKKPVEGTTSPQNVVPPADEKPAEGTTFSGPKDLACDTYGKCMNKIVTAFSKTKAVAANKPQEMKDHATETANDPVEKPDKAKDTFYRRFLEKFPGHTLGEFLVKVKNAIAKGLIGEAIKVVRNTIAIVKDVTSKRFDIIDSPKRVGIDISSNVSGEVKDGIEHVTKQTKESIKNVEDVLGQGNMHDIVNRLKEVVYDGIWFVLYWDKMGLVAGLVHMVGFSTAYGMCVWVTFVSSYILSRNLPRRMFGMVQSRLYPVYFRAMAYCVCSALLGNLVSEKNEVLGSKIGMFQSSSLVCALLMVLTNLILLEPKATKAMYKRMKLEKEEGRGMGVAVAAKDGMVDGGSATVMRSVANGKGPMNGKGMNGKGVEVAGKDRMAYGGYMVAKSVSMGRQEVLRLNEKLKRLNAYSSALNLFTLVALTWHMAYMGQRLQATHGK